MQIVQNVGSTAVQAGDLVAFYGIAAPLEAGEPPVIQVATLTRANSTAVAGVVYSRYNIEAITKATDSGEKLGSAFEVTPDGSVAPGEYLLLVVQGPAQVRATAAGGPIQPGDLLTSAATAGMAARAGQVTVESVAIAAPGTVFGKALEALPAGDGLIYVYVTLQ
jgi:hypothetical protein